MRFWIIRNYTRVYWKKYLKEFKTSTKINIGFLVRKSMEDRQKC